MIIPIVSAGLVLLAIRKARRPFGVMTKERDRIYRAAIGGALKDPEILRQLADKFEKERLFPQAALLRQRADLRELPPEIKKARNHTFRKAMRSKKKAAILQLADAYDQQGCTSACEKLRAYAAGLPDVTGEDETLNEEVPDVEMVETPLDASPVESTDQAAAQ